MFIPFASQNQFDPDAGAFINVTGIGGIEAVAINNLVNQLKSAGLWSTMRAIYPMVGGTANSCKYNLVNPQDTNAAYRLSFAGTWTFDNNGAKPNGAAGTYADTFAAPNSVFTLTNGSFSYYSFTNNAGIAGAEFGAGQGGTGETVLILRFSDNNQYCFYGGGGGSAASSNSSGYLINNRGANVEGWKNGVRVINTGAASLLASNNLYLAAQNNGSGNNRNSSRGCAFAHIGSSLPTGGAVNLTNIVNTFCSTLGRNVF